MMLLIGITSPDTARILAATKPRVEGASLHFVREGAIVAVLATLPRNILRLFTKHAGLKDLVRLQRILEALLPHGPLIAARPGTRADEQAIRRLLVTEQDRLIEALGKFGLDIQYQIIVLWDGAAILSRASSDVALRRAMAAAADGEADGRTALLAHVHALRDGLQAQLSAFIAPAILESQILPLDGEDMVANLTVRIRRDSVEDLEEALRPLDTLLPGNSRIRLIGPLPALSFAAVSLDRIDAANIVEARQLLGVRPNATLAELRAAYYQVAQDHHPDVTASDDGADVMAAASRAYKLLKRIAPLAAADDACTVLDIVRADETTRRAA